MIKHRVINGAVLIAMLVGALYLPAVGVFLIIPMLTALMMWECYGLLTQGGMSGYRQLGTAGGVVLVLLTGWFGYYHQGGMGHEWESVFLGALVFVVLVRQCLAKNDERPLSTIAATLMPILYVAFLFNFYTKLLLHWPEGDGRLLLFYMILIVKVTDMAAYFTGCSIGRHKLIPRISPAKTWEGCAGGILGGLLTSMVFWRITEGQIGPVTLSIADAAILGIVLPITGIVGDLIESMLKRAAAVKDSGSLLKGMGGVLDVLDSLLFAGLVLYMYVLIIHPS